MPGPEKAVQVQSPEKVTIDRQTLREHLYLIEQAAVGKIAVVPGTELAYHYPTDQATRTAVLQGLLDGTEDPIKATPMLKPDGLTYDAREIGSISLSTMMGKVRDASAKATHYDYERFAKFMAGMQGVGIDVATTEAIYDRVVQSRIRKIFMDTYGPTGRQQMNEAIKAEAASTVSGFINLPSGEKIFEALKQNWAANDLMTMSSSQLATIIDQLSPAEREVFETLKNPYRQFVQAGTAESFAQLTQAVKSALETTEKKEGTEQEEESEQKQEMKDYTQDLNKEKKKVGPPQTPKDPGIPPDDKDEYKTSKERSREGVFFYVTPSGTSRAPLLGYYAKGRKSYYDIATKTWSKKKVVTPYQTNIPGSERQTISSASIITGGNLKALPIPNGYALDASSLRFQKGKKPPQLFRDQNGCFYIKAATSSSFSVDFLKEPNLFTNPPIAEDTKQLYQGQLSPQTEALMRTLAGGNIDKALAIQKYILENHFYPAEGDLEIAQALQYKLRQAHPDNYIQTIDTSKYLECYSTHTLGIAMLRKMGVPARLVIGDHVDKVKNGKAQLDSTTGHAWVEVWDGAKWVRFDFTPKAEHKKDQNKDQDKDQQQNEPGQQAEDNGMDQGRQGEEGEEGSQQSGEGQPGESQQGGESGESGESGEGQAGEGQGGEGKPGTEGKAGRQGPGRPDMKFNDQGKPGEASNQQMQSGQQEVDRAQNTLKQMQQVQQRLEQQLQDAKSFQDLKNLQQQAAQADTFDDMKQQIQDEIAKMEQAKKEELKETIDQMAEDGFMDEEKAKQLLDQIDEGQTQQLDRAQRQVQTEGRLFREYQDIKERVRPKVDQWFKWFVQRLPKAPDIVLDENSLMTGGRLNIRAAMKPTNLYLGRVYNPRVVRSSERPMFLATIEVDLSRSVMSMNPAKKKATEELMVFYCELFDRIEQRFGYMRWALDAFHDSVIPIKGYDQSYSSSKRNLYPGGAQETVKVRLMKALKTEGGTYMLEALKHSAKGLNEQVAKYPRYMSSFYFIGDGEDSRSDPRFGGDPRFYEKIKRFVDNISPQNGFGPHQHQAIFLGEEQEKRQLAAVFGEEHTSVCSDFDQVIQMSMMKFDEDIRAYLRNKIH